MTYAESFTQNAIDPSVSMTVTATPYDDVYKTLATDCPKLLLPLLNETFGTCYTGQEEVIPDADEYFLTTSEGAQQKRIADNSFRVVSGKSVRHYLYECESTPDGAVLVRFFEYAFLAALRQSKLQENKLIITFPRLAVLYLRARSTTPDHLEVQLTIPEKQQAQYQIPALKFPDYSVESLFEKKLYLLIPFSLFLFEHEFAIIEKSNEQYEKLILRFQWIRNQLDLLLEQGELDRFQYLTICTMSRKVIRHLARKHQRIRKGVEASMGGQVLMHEAKYMLNKGIEEGIAQERQRTAGEIAQERQRAAGEIAQERQRAASEIAQERQRAAGEIAQERQRADDALRQLEELQSKLRAHNIQL